MIFLSKLFDLFNLLEMQKCFPGSPRLFEWKAHKVNLVYVGYKDTCDQNHEYFEWSNPLLSRMQEALGMKGLFQCVSSYCPN